MPLKTSFFNFTLFRKNLSRSWPLWGGVTAVGSLLPLYLVLGIMRQRSYGQTIFFEREDFVQFLYQAAVYFLPVFTACYAILVAMFVWSYLHNSRSASFMHSLSISRTGLFVTNTLSGLAMLLIPYVVVGGLLCVIAVCMGAMDAGAVALTALAVILDTLLFFGMGTLCAAVTGNVIATAVYYIILNFAVPAMDFLVNTLAREFIFGLTDKTSSFSLWFSPVISLYEHVEVVSRTADGIRMEIPEINGFGVILLYGVVGLALLAASLLLYRVRSSESAGDVVAYRWLRPVFRFGISLVCALTLGRVLYEMFWNSLFNNGFYEQMLPMAIFMMIAAVVGYYAASMLLEKSLRVFKGSLKGVGLVCAAIAVLCLTISLDLFGVERRLPDVQSIREVQVNGLLDITCSAEEFPELCEDILALNQAIIADKKYVRSTQTETWDEYDSYFNSMDIESTYHESVRWRTVVFEYTLQNGSQLQRSYYVPLRESRLKQEGTYDAMLLQLATDPDVLVASLTMPAGAEIAAVSFEYYLAQMDHYESTVIASADGRLVYEALVRDAREGNFISQGNSDFWWSQKEGVITEGTPYDYDSWLYIDYRVRVKDGISEYTSYGHLTVTLQPTMTHTINALLSVGALDQETIAGWNS